MAMTKLALRRFRKGRNDKMDLQLTALIDIVVFLLVFLIQVVSISKINISLQGDMELPDSTSVDAANRAITVQINRSQEFFVENVKINLVPGPLWSIENKRLIVERLQAVKNELDVVIKKSSVTERFNLIINLAMDKNLEYSNIQNLMDLAAGVGLIQFKFIVIE